MIIKICMNCSHYFRLSLITRNIWSMSMSAANIISDMLLQFKVQTDSSLILPFFFHHQFCSPTPSSYISLCYQAGSCVNITLLDSQYLRYLRYQVTKIFAKTQFVPFLNKLIPAPGWHTPTTVPWLWLIREFPRLLSLKIALRCLYIIQDTQYQTIKPSRCVYILFSTVAQTHQWRQELVSWLTWILFCSKKNKLWTNTNTFQSENFKWNWIENKSCFFFNSNVDNVWEKNALLYLDAKVILWKLR